MDAVFILMVAILPYVLCTDESETGQYQYPDPLPPEAFEFMFNAPFPVPWILEASRYWNTKQQCENFKFLRDKIEDKKVDSETKKYAESILTEATNRLKGVLKEADLEMDDKYDAYDFAVEMKNIEEGEPPVHKDLYRTIFKYFWPEKEEQKKD